MNKWTRIPVPIDKESDRRALTSILAEYGLTVQLAKDRLTPKGSLRKFIEYRLPTTETQGKSGDLMP